MPPKKRNGESNVQAVLRSSRQRRLEGRNAFEPHNAMYAPLQGDRKLVWSLVRPYAQDLMKQEQIRLEEKLDNHLFHKNKAIQVNDRQFELELVEFIMDTNHHHHLQPIDPKNELEALHEVALENYHNAKEEYNRLVFNKRMILHAELQQCKNDLIGTDSVIKNLIQ